MPTCPECKHEWSEDKKEGVLPDLDGDVRYEGAGVLRYEAAEQDKPVNIDRTNFMMKGVRAMLAKPVRKDYFYGLAAQQKVASRYEGMAVGCNHDYAQGPPTIEHTVGKVIRSYTDDAGTLFDVKYNPAHERMEQILKDAETGLNTISLSCITTRCEQRGNEVVSFNPTGCDFVINAGQTTRMFEQAQNPTTLPPATDTRLEQALADITLLKGKLATLETARPATVAADVKKFEQSFAARGVDLAAFHDEFCKAK